MRVGVVKESAPGERRVAAVPETVRKLCAAGVEVVVEAAAGAAAHYPDADYVEAGATVGDALACDVVFTVTPLDVGRVGALREGATLVGFLPPTAHPELLRALVGRRATAFSLDLLPRISRAQSADALSSQALVAGYHAVLVAADRLPKFFPMFMTAAGTVPPAKVLVLGAGVAGLQAIATARRLGAVVEAYDVRTAAAEEVRSLGATFLDLGLEAQEGAGGYARAQSEEFLARQRDLIGARVAASDVVVTTAAVPGRRAPLLVTTNMVGAMRPGSVVVDLAAEGGGNCELTRAGEDVRHGDVLVVGLRNAPSALPTHASALYARNLTNLLMLMVKDGEFAPDFDDEVVAGCCLLRAGEVVSQLARDVLEEGNE